jgi:L-lysine exporter family protein LysE/ArgO
MELITPILQGFLLGMGLIIAIGAQNAFVLRQGLMRQHVFAVALVCATCDSSLILVGVTGIGGLIATSGTFMVATTWGGVLFLGYYGLRSFRSALRPGSLGAANGVGQLTLRATVLSALSFSLLNPHVYLDTLVLVGSVGGHYPADLRPLFALGAMAASTIWFFGLSYGAGLLTPYFSRPATWRVLDMFVGCVMWVVAGLLLWTTYQG